MTDAQSFLTWCAGRDIGLVLHGHRHVPRLVIDDVATEQARRQYRRITTVGCGTSRGAGGAPMSFNVIEWNTESRSWNVDFQISQPDGQPWSGTCSPRPPRPVVESVPELQQTCPRRFGARPPAPRDALKRSPRRFHTARARLRHPVTCIKERWHRF